ncbi:MAG: YjcQ family protein [Clostridia bacterium]|nr:YjcQ family protein [Clostridia bacterium]
MARDDYFVVVYKILVYLYNCLKLGEPPDVYNVLTAENYGINQNYFEYIFTELLEEGYIKGVSTFKVIGKASPSIKLTSSITIKPKGIEYLQENSALAKAKDFIKEIKEIVPGL